MRLTSPSSGPNVELNTQKLLRLTSDFLAMVSAKITKLASQQTHLVQDNCYCATRNLQNEYLS